MKVMFKGLAAAAVLSAVAAGAAAQTGGNILLNPDVEVGIDGGSTFTNMPVPPFGIAFGTTAAESWGFFSMPQRDYSIRTELLPSDFVPGGMMLHVRAHNVVYVIVRPSLTYTPAVPHRAAFCAWVKVTRGRATGVALDLSTPHDTPTGDWQQLIVNADNASMITPAITFMPQIAPDSADAVFGDTDFYIATADLTLRGSLSQCPRATLNNLSRGREPLDLPPRRPVVEHPDWNDRPDERPAPDDRDFGGSSRHGKPHDHVEPSQNAPWGQK